MNRRTTLTAWGAVARHYLHDPLRIGLEQPARSATHGAPLVKSLTSATRSERDLLALDPLLQLIAATYRTPGPALRADLCLLER